MNKVLFPLFLILLEVMIVFSSCQKEISCQSCRDQNKPPVASAGPDQVITLPTDSIVLNGSASSDPDGNLSSFLWKKVSGPSAFLIANPNISTTILKSLVAGIYQFELKVTDAGGLFATDTVEITVSDPLQNNQPPVAKAGPDQTITLPLNNITIDGSSSTDPDNNITAYAWTKIAGPSTFSITNAGFVQTSVNNLSEGIYLFELRVTDAGGLFSRDTMQVKVNPQQQVPIGCNSNRPQVTAQLIPLATLSQSRQEMAVAASGNKIVFAGGALPVSTWSSRVDIYDISSQLVSTAELCVERIMIGAVAAGNKIFFAGGEYGDGTWPLDSVDIYDISSNTWSVSHLSSAGHSIAATTVGNKVFFAGGDQGFNGTPGIERARQVDIYDLNTGTWSTTTLSEGKRIGHNAVSINNKAYFAGGETGAAFYASNKVDVYDNATNTWSTISMQEGKTGLSGIAISGKIFWAGGMTGSLNPSYNHTCLVEIKNVNTGLSEITYLSKPGGVVSVLKNDKIVFFGSGNQFDIYDITNNTWSIGVLPVSMEGASVISVNNIIYVAGGIVNGVFSNQIWRLEF